VYNLGLDKFFAWYDRQRWRVAFEVRAGGGISIQKS
jgi:hypothetical protein